jgi:hypothetical protein
MENRFGYHFLDSVSTDFDGYIVFGGRFHCFLRLEKTANKKTHFKNNSSNY